MSATRTPASRRVRKRHLIPLGLLGAIAVVLVWMYWRGTVAEARERNPRTAAEGPITQLIEREGRKSLRCAIVIDAPPAAVWNVVSDYDSQEEFLPYLTRIASERLEGGRVRITGIAHSRMWGDWDFESVVSEKTDPETGHYSIHWDEADKKGFAVNRGSWTLTPEGEGTLAVYDIQTDMQGYPAFLVRNIVMNRLGGVLRAVRDEVIRRGN